MPVDLKGVKEHREILKKLQGDAIILSYPVCYLDWLIEQAEKVEKYEKALKEIDSLQVTTLFVAQRVAKKALEVEPNKDVEH